MLPAHPEILNGNSTVLYRAKVKLHGTNAAIQCHADGRVIAQSRTSELSVGNDNAGFAAWVKAHEEYWRADDSPSGDLRRGMVIYGEWIGPGIQKNVAVSSIPEKSFVIFAARPMLESNPNTIMGSSHMKDGKIVENDFAFAEDLVVEPAALEAMQHKCPDTYILPWFWPNVFPINWNQNPDMLQAATNVINQAVEGVEAEDPWVKRVFGVKGTGEGLVFYPVSKEHLGLSNFNNLVFKAKGEKHKNIKTAAPADVNPAVAASVDAFVDMVLTPARLGPRRYRCRWF